MRHLADIRVSSVDKKSVDGEIAVRLCNYTDVYYREVITDDPDFMRATASPEQIHEFGLRRGDVLITKDSETPDDIGVAAFVPEDLPGVVCGYHLARLRPRDGALEGRFLRWAIQSSAVRRQMTIAATGVTRFGLRADAIASIVLPHPSIQHQRAIADYLDTETVRIDDLVSARQRQLDCFDERDVVLAYRTVSGGGVPGPRKHSGLDWLGEVPDEWPVAPVNSAYEVRLGRMLNAERAASDDPRPYLRNVNIRWDVVDTSDVAVMDFPVAERPRYALRQGDLLINEGGAGIGRAAIWDGAIEECYFQKSVLRLRPYVDANPRWMIECLRVAVAMKVLLVEGNLATIPHVPAEALRVKRFPMPPRVVQDSLLDELGRERAHMMSMRTAITRQIALLQEHKQALITAAVTGELDIPGVAA